jgi:hypothetical protein
VVCRHLSGSEHADLCPDWPCAHLLKEAVSCQKLTPLRNSGVPAITLCAKSNALNYNRSLSADLMQQMPTERFLHT